MRKSFIILLSILFILSNLFAVGIKAEDISNNLEIKKFLDENESSIRSDLKDVVSNIDSGNISYSEPTRYFSVDTVGGANSMEDLVILDREFIGYDNWTFDVKLDGEEVATVVYGKMEGEDSYRWLCKSTYIDGQNTNIEKFAKLLNVKRSEVALIEPLGMEYKFLVAQSRGHLVITPLFGDTVINHMEKKLYSIEDLESYIDYLKDNRDTFPGQILRFNNYITLPSFSLEDVVTEEPLSSRNMAKYGFIGLVVIAILVLIVYGKKLFS
ncbi:MAG: hypothetical protein PT956_00690 [Firmicutes bacterium]|nr:hypothetical protein [Bacillota bacterium]